MKTAYMSSLKNSSVWQHKQAMQPVRAFGLGVALCVMLLPNVSLGQEQPKNVPSIVPSSANAATPMHADPTLLANTKIEPGFLLRVEVADEAQLTGEYEVDAEGVIHFTLADEQGKHKEEWSVKVGQKTAEEANALVAESLKAYLRQPNVHVMLLKRPRLHVEMAGTGCRPGLLELPLDAHLSDVMSVCKQNADYAHLLLARKQKVGDKSSVEFSSTIKTVVDGGTPGGEENTPATRTLTINFEDYQQGQNGDDPKLEDGDKIYIQMKPPGAPEHVLRTVRVVGEVGREVDIPLSAGMTVKDALTRAGGLKDTADPDNIRLHRGESGKDFELKAAGIQDEDAKINMVLEPGDYLIAYKRDLSMRWGIDGEVMAGNVFPYVPGFKMTITRAVSIAGGLTKKAEHHKGVLRKGYLINPTKVRDIIFDYDAIKNKKQQDFEVEAGDVVVILQRQHRPTIWQKLLPLALKFIPLPI